MIYRDEIKEGAPVASAYIDIDGFAAHGCETENPQDELLAAGKVEVIFEKGEQFIEQKAIDSVNGKSKIIKANNDQLVWRFGENPLVTAETKYTEGFVGFAPDIEISLKYIKFKAQNKFCAMFITSLDDKPLGEAKRLFLTAVARFRHVGMEYSADGKEVLKLGKQDELLMEGVNAQIEMLFKCSANIYALDSQGARAKKIAVTETDGGAAFNICAEDEAYWYEIEL